MTSFWEEQPSPAFYAGAPFHDIPMSEACPDSLEAAVRAWREQKKAPELQQFRGFSLWQRVKDSNPHIQSQSLLCYPYTNPLSSFLYLCVPQRTDIIIQKNQNLSSLFQKKLAGGRVG